jgi:hypothetical protein
MAQTGTGKKNRDMTNWEDVESSARVLLMHFHSNSLDRLGKTTGHLRHDNRSAYRESNTRRPEYETRAVNTEPRRAVSS